MKNPEFNKYKSMIEKTTGMKVETGNKSATGDGTVPIKRFRF